MAGAVGPLRAAWENVTALREEVLQDAQTGGDDALTHALGVFSKPPYPKELSALVAEWFDRFAEEFSRDEPWNVSFWLGWAERAAIVDKVQTSLDRMRTWPSWLRYQAASVLLPIRASQAALLSQEAAQAWPHHWNSRFLQRSTFVRLIRANVSAWHHRVLELLKLRQPLPLRSTFLLARTLGPLLPNAERRVLQEALYKTLGRLEYRWIQNGRDAWDTVRVADLYAQFLHESGGRAERQRANP